jgi:hypothetical protein
MIKKLLFLLIYILIVSCQSKSSFIEIKSNENAYLIRNKHSIGEVYKENFKFDFIEKSNQRFTPSIDEVNQAEILLKAELKKSNGKNKRFILKNWKDYKRQYFGYLNSNDEKILNVTFFLNEDIKNQNDQIWKEQYEFYLDGGPANWIAKINMSSRKVEVIAINGVAHNMFSTSNVLCLKK